MCISNKIKRINRKKIKNFIYMNLISNMVGNRLSNMVIYASNMFSGHIANNDEFLKSIHNSVWIYRY